MTPATLHVPNLRDGYKTIVDHVLEHGEWSAPRGARTLEVIHTSIVVEDPRDLFPHGMGRRVRRKLLAADALQLVGGHQDPQQMFDINPGMRRFTDFGVFHGAYGPRIRPQYLGLQRRLEQDPETRRAVLTFWDPLRDGAIDEANNFPCMTQVQFLVREGVLTTHGLMRANDLWLGLSYDAFTLQQLGFTVANCFGWDVGPYHHYAASLHLYEDHVEAARNNLTEPTLPALTTPRGFGYFGLTIEEAAERARLIGAGTPPNDLTESEFWYMEALHGPDEA